MELINIITRCSRKDKFLNLHYPSIQNQTYRNFNHIITYENDDMKSFLLENTDPEVTILCRVFPTKKMEGAYRSFYYSQHGPYDNLEYLDYKLWNENEETTDYPDWGGGRWKFKHFPYNLYMLKAEQKVKKGWVLYLDDDDMLCEPSSLEGLAQKLEDQDTLYFFRCVSSNSNIKTWGVHNFEDRTDNLLPLDYALNHALEGYPPALSVGFNSSTQCFHSKYLEYTAWDEWSGSDWKTVQSLWYNIPKKERLELKITQLSPPGGGK